MSYSICKIKNKKGQVDTLHGHEFQIDEIYNIQDSIRNSWSSSDDVLTAIGNQEYEIHDSIGAISGVSNQMDHLKAHTPIESTPLEPKNVHTMCNFPSRLVMNPEDVGEGVYEAWEYVTIESSTHTHVKISGSKARIDGYHIDDIVEMWICMPDNTPVWRYGSWLLEVQEGYISCEKDHDDAAGHMQVGMKIGLKLITNSNTQRIIRSNWKAKVYDGDVIT